MVKTYRHFVSQNLRTSNRKRSDDTILSYYKTSCWYFYKVIKNWVILQDEENTLK